MRISTKLRNFITTLPVIQQMVSDGKIGSDTVMPEGYIFEGKPYVTVEKLNKSAILVVSSVDSWEPPLRERSLEYPRVDLDIWASPTRDANGGVQEYDADDLIDEIYMALKPYIHIVHRSKENGGIFDWNGAFIVSSEVIDGPIYRDVRDGNGARMARISIGVSM